MYATIQKWGNSLAVRIPETFARRNRIRRGDRVSLTFENGYVVARPAKRRKYTLEELLSKITPKNRHTEIDWG